MANIHKRGAGYQAQVRIRGFQPLTHSFKTKADAVQWANEREAEVRRGTYVDTRSLRAEWLLTAVGSKGGHGGESGPFAHPVPADIFRPNIAIPDGADAVL